MLGRSKPTQTQTQQLLDELAESYGHFKMAAGHMAGGAAEKITPKYDKARSVASRGWSTTTNAFSPLYDQVREGATNARREYNVTKRNKWPALAGLLAAGAAVGAAGAMVARRRRGAAQWDEYDPMPAVDGAADSTDHAKDRLPSATRKVTAGAASVAESVSTQAGKIAESLHGKSSSPGPSGTADTLTDKASDTATSIRDKGSGPFAAFADDKGTDSRRS